MSVLSIQPTFPIFTDIDGQPLENGYIFIGQANQNPITNPISVFFNIGLTVLAAQPIRTIGGYPANAGTPGRLYVNSDYSIQVQNKNGSVVYSSPTATEQYSSVVVNNIDFSSLTASTALALDASKNIISVTNTGTGNNVLATSPALIGPRTDTILELTAAAGVTIDGVLLKDTTVTANTVKASGTASSQGKVEFFEDTDNGTNFVALQAAAAIAADVTFTLPAADGTANQVLKTDGSGNLGFATPSGGKLLQVVSDVNTNTFSTSSQTFVTTTQSLAITPSSASNKVLVMFNAASVSTLAANTSIDIEVRRSSTVVCKGGYYTANVSGTQTIPFGVIQSLDSPNTTSSVTYEVFAKEGGLAGTVSVNADRVLTLMEIA